MPSHFLPSVWPVLAIRTAVVARCRARRRARPTGRTHLPYSTLSGVDVDSFVPKSQESSQTTTLTRIMSMMRARTRLPLSASGGMPASGILRAVSAATAVGVTAAVRRTAAGPAGAAAGRGRCRRGRRRVRRRLGCPGASGPRTGVVRTRRAAVRVAGAARTAARGGSVRARRPDCPRGLALTASVGRSESSADPAPAPRPAELGRSGRSPATSRPRSRKSGRASASAEDALARHERARRLVVPALAPRAVEEAPQDADHPDHQQARHRVHQPAAQGRAEGRRLVLLDVPDLEPAAASCPACGPTWRWAAPRRGRRRRAGPPRTMPR